MTEIDALRALVKAVGDLPAALTDQATQKAYSEALELIEPDTFTERFMNQKRDTK